MRSETAKRLLSKTPLETKIFVEKYSDLVVLINSLIKAKGHTQKSLAESMGKKPSEISKWLNNEHNFTLRSIAKLEAELGATLIQIPQVKSFKHQGGATLALRAIKPQNKLKTKEFKSGEIAKNQSIEKVA